MIDRAHPLSISRQARLLGLSRSSAYYRPLASTERDLALMAAIDEIHTELPFYGIRRIRGELRGRGFAVGRQHVATLMRQMGITAIAPKRRLSKPAPDHKIYPYLLRGLEICEAGHVWCADVTYLPLARGFCYLTAIMDWASRRVLSWRLSNTLDAAFCIEALEEALERYDSPEIFNTDQGSQFTCEGFTSVLAEPWRRDQHGRTGPLARQRLHRAALEERQARGGLPESLREPDRGPSRAGCLLRLLQPPTPPSGARRPHPR